ncbi:MAG: DUF2029 domain-containing protein [Chloroflexaceae bacterium]|nr:DUF2029 domain-containing protein [Chloroflexaceae bacterium]
MALATAIKLYPGWLGVYHLLRQQYRIVASAVGVGVGLLVLPVLVHGVTPYVDFVREMFSGRLYPHTAEFNISVTGFFQRLLTVHRYGIAIAVQPMLANILIGGCSLALVVLCLVTRTSDTREPERLLGYSLWICVMLLLSPVNGYYNLVVVLLPVLAMLRWLEQHPNRRVLVWVGIATCYAAFSPVGRGCTRPCTPACIPVGVWCCSRRRCTGYYSIQGYWCI